MKNNKYLIDPNTKELIRVRPIPTPTPTNGQWVYDGERLYHKNDGRPAALPPSSNGTRSYGTIAPHKSNNFFDVLIFFILLLFMYATGFLTGFHYRPGV